MLNVEDFTLLRRGFEVPLEGRVETCPRCGRNGIEERPECGVPYFLHVQASDVLGDGMRVEPLDSCALPVN
jgi:hypothetical protein